LRSRRAGLKRIGLLALALVLALGSLGVAYAAWTDSVYINSTVYTGTLDVDVTGASSTFVYKVPGALGLVEPDPDNGVLVYQDTVVHFVQSVTAYEDPDPYTPATDPPGFLVASAVTTWVTTNDADSAEMTFSGVFPCLDFRADLELTYRGTVPGKISVAEVTSTDTGDNYDLFTDLWDLGTSSNHTEGIWVDAEVSTDDGDEWTTVDDPLGLQLERNDVIHITVHVHIPEGSAYENKNLNFTGQITVVQWNEYEATATP
jgi:hypothetical protein